MNANIDILEPPLPIEDAAWASVYIPVERSWLLFFCSDLERLFRINPYLQISKWERLLKDCFRVEGVNSSQQPAFSFAFEIKVEEVPEGLRLIYSDGMKSSTTLKLETEGEGTRLSIIDEYTGIVETDREQKLQEVDRSLVKWLEDIQAYLVNWKRWSWFLPYRWYMRYIWQPMKPIGRRITYMLLWITLFEIALIMLGIGIYWLEYK